MNSLKRPWINLILAPVWFLIVIVIISIYFGGQGVSEADTASEITNITPTIILAVQILILSVLLLTTKKDKFNIFTKGWSTHSKVMVDIFGGLLTGSIIAVLYIWLFSPFQTYLQTTIGDYVPPGETMLVLGKQAVPFFIANVLLAPFVEESLYRNYALTRFLENHGKAKSIILTATMFGLLHWLGGFWYILMTALFIGLPFAIIAITRKNIIWVFVAHLTLNLIEFIYIMSHI
jgi:uncharacterized protein